MARTLGLTVLLTFIAPLVAAQGRPGEKGEEIKTYELSRPAPAKAGERDKPQAILGVKDLATRAEVMAEEKLEAAIATLNELIETTDDDDPAKPEYLSRLADLYWDKADSYFNKAFGNELFSRLKAAQDAGDTAAAAAIEEEQKALMEQGKFWQQETVKVYQKIVDNYPEYPGLDRVLFNLGYILVLMREPDEAYKYFARILRESPNSTFVPAALLNIGEFYFEKGRMDEALRVYSEVENFPASEAYGLAIYKKGWCFYNLGKYEEAMNQFLRVIEYAKSDASKNIRYRDQLLSDGQRDLVKVYTQIGSPDNAIKVFKKITPDSYLDLTIMLAEAYAGTGEFAKSTRVFKHLITEFKTREDAYRIIQFQREILENTYNQGVAVKVVEEARRLIGVLETYSEKAPPNFLQEERAKVEELLRVIATAYHKEVAATKNEQTMEFTALLYREYLRLFPEAPEAKQIRLNSAILLSQAGKYAEAAEEYERIVAESDPNDEMTKKAAHEAVVNYYRMFDISGRGKTKGEEEVDLEPKELPEFEKRLLNACNRYLAVATPQDPDIVEARILAGIVLYQYNHFEEAAQKFREVIQMAPEHPNAPDAARLLLSSLHHMRDIKGLNRAAEEIEKNPLLMKGDVPGIVSRIREQADFNKCYEHEQEGRHKVAGECFLDYVKRFPQTPLKDKAFINAANNFFKARLVERALEAYSELVNNMPKSPLAPKALFNIGEVYRRLAVYSEASRFYETFVKLLPKHELAEEALRYATVFRSGLGEYDAAIEDLKLYLKLFPDSKHAPNVFFEIGVAYEKKGRYQEALRQFQEYQKKYGLSGGPDLYLRARLEIAKALRALKREKEALNAFAAVVSDFEALSDSDKEKLTSQGLSAVAEARFVQGEAVLEEVRAVRIGGSEAAIHAAIEKKLNLLKTAMEIFNSVEAFGQPHWTIAAFSRKGFGYQELAKAVEDIPPPPEFKTEEQKALFREKAAERAQPIWEQAKAEFRRCIETAQRLKWYNEYSLQAEEALMKLEPEFRSLPDIRPLPGYYTLNVGKPRLLPLVEGEDVPRYTDEKLQEKVRSAAESANPRPEALYDYGAILEAAGNLDEAAKWYEKALAKDPKLADAVARLGVIAYAKGKTKEAMAYFEQARQIDPANSVAHNYDAAKKLAERDFPEAINHARMALVSDPDSMDAYLVLAATYYEMGLYDVGILVGRNALALEPNDAPIQNILGLIFAKKGEVRQAVYLFEKAVEANPNLLDARMNLGAMTLAYKDFETAEEQFKKVLELRPEHRDAKMGLAVAYRGLGKNEEAMKLLGEIAASNPSYPDVHFNMCLLLQENLNQIEKALSECETFARMAGPSHPKANEVKRRIEGLKILIEARREAGSQ